MISDSSISEVDLEKDHIKGDRRILVIPEAHVGLKELTKSIMKFSQVKRIVKGVFVVGGSNEPIQKMLNEIPHISFRKVRDVPKIRDKNKDAELKRTFALVTYHLNSPTPQQKKKIQRSISHSVSIRLRPGVLLFPYLRIKDNRKYFGSEESKRLLNSKEFTTEIASLNANISRFTHLRIAGPRSLSLANAAFQRTVLGKFDTLNDKIGTLRESINDPELPTQKLRQKYSALFQQYRDSKVRFEAIQRIMSFEAEHSLKKIYDKLLRVRKLIAERN